MVARSGGSEWLLTDLCSKRSWSKKKHTHTHTHAITAKKKPCSFSFFKGAPPFAKSVSSTSIAMFRLQKAFWYYPDPALDLLLFLFSLLVTLVVVVVVVCRDCGCECGCGCSGGSGGSGCGRGMLWWW